MHHPTDRIAHTTAFVIPVVEHWLEQEIKKKDDLFEAFLGDKTCLYPYSG